MAYAGDTSQRYTIKDKIGTAQPNVPIIGADGSFNRVLREFEDNGWRVGADRRLHKRIVLDVVFAPLDTLLNVVLY
jgi:hypothetical protein